MIRRKYELPKSRDRTFSFYPTIENVGRVHVEQNGLTYYFVTDSALNVVQAPANATVVDSGLGYDRIDCDLIGANFDTIGEDFLLEIDWAVLGEPLVSRNSFIRFDVVAKEWTTEVHLGTLRDILPPIGLRLEKQGRYHSPVKDAETMAATRISDAMDRFDNVLRKIVRQTRVESRAALVPDFQRFDRIVAYLAVALTVQADLRFDLSDHYIQAAMRSFENMRLVGYDSNQDFVKDDEIIGPDRALELQSEFFGGY